jgi:uncharacterized RDD family membrane protein YckC
MRRLASRASRVAALLADLLITALVPGALFYPAYQHLVPPEPSPLVLPLDLLTEEERLAFFAQVDARTERLEQVLVYCLLLFTLTFLSYQITAVRRRGQTFGMAAVEVRVSGDAGASRLWKILGPVLAALGFLGLATRLALFLDSLPLYDAVRELPFLPGGVLGALLIPLVLVRRDRREGAPPLPSLYQALLRGILSLYPALMLVGGVFLLGAGLYLLYLSGDLSSRLLLFVGGGAAELVLLLFSLLPGRGFSDAGAGTRLEALSGDIFEDEPATGSR